MKKQIFIAALSLVSLSAGAQQIKQKLSSIPYSLEILNTPVEYHVGDNEVSITAKGKTNLFNNPNGVYYVQDAPMIVFEPAGDFTLSARVTGELRSIYDVAALVVYNDRDTWAKLCYENSVDKVPTIVSVVTRKYSDDCNSMTAGAYAWLSIVKKGSEYSFFYSANGRDWKMIRSFHLQTEGAVKAGFAAHGSRGEGFTGRFSEIKYSDHALENMRGI